jgi:4-amino-4-deoxy-L-arabinose transferase-like glycosyltransferase
MILAAAVRVAWVLLVPTKPVGDFAMYLESASHVVEHGALDPEFVYMPGYVLLVAGILGLGGGLLAIKLILGALLGAAGAGAVYALTAAFWCRGAALLAALAYALWPAGVAVSSVTGTDMPAAVLVLGALWGLVHWGRTRPWLATVAFGVGMGLAAYVRAVAMPLAVFAIFYFRAAGASWRQAVARAGVGAFIALVMLAPWVLRNRLRYGEWFLTDSHGGLTALVGVNPNTDGRYSRSLNRLFKEATGYTLLAEPHRRADRAAYDLARDWSAFSPPYALGLIALKAERLLDNERALLYWPLYRQGVLRPGPVRAFFDRHRARIEAVTDGFWVALVTAYFAGIGLALARRRWQTLSVIPIQLALTGVYALYFAEARYHLPIAALMFPIAAGPPVVLAVAVARWWRGRRSGAADSAGAVAVAGAGAGERGEPGPGVPRARWREAGAAAAAVGVLFIGWPATQAIGAHLRDRHRWAAHLCRIDGRTTVCKWAPATSGLSPIQGVHDGLGLHLATPDAAGRVAARASLPLPPGAYAIRARLDATGPGSDPADCTATLAAGSSSAPPIPVPQLTAAARADAPLPVELTTTHRAAALDLLLSATCRTPHPNIRVWLSGLEITTR